VPGQEIDRAATLLCKQLGPNGIRLVGGSNWWRWRQPHCPLKAEWIEMRSDYHMRKRNETPGNRVMLYIHGGAYYFGSVDEHRYQIQRHARKLGARALAPRYRLAPGFPFPCGLQDCLAAYLYLLTCQDPNTITLAGDSAGAGMVLSMLVILRDQGVPLPAGAILISPWVDLTHSFPSVSSDCPYDYIPQSGFHHKPSMAWPPPDNKLYQQSKPSSGLSNSENPKQPAGTTGTAPSVETDTQPHITVSIDGTMVDVHEQLQVRMEIILHLVY
jgi:acetyl esterase/lipase